MSPANSLDPSRHEDEIVALVALLQGNAVPKVHLAGMIENLGSAIELLARVHGQPAGQSGLFSAIPAEVIEQARAEVASWQGQPYRVSTVFDLSYPSILRTIHDRPPLVFVAGTPAALERTGISIVGTRQASEEGKRRAARLARELGRRGLVIVSGLARGIDTAAHRAALDVGALTVAVIGTGIDRTYPTENAFLAREIVEAGGALVSQFLPTTPPAPGNFPQRNVTMSGLSVATVVVEASETSGARMQARSALQHGRTVFLLQSLVDAHQWARTMVDVGVNGTRALVLADTADVTDRLSPEYSPLQFQIA